MKRTCLFLVALMVLVAIFTWTTMSMAGPLGLFRNDSAANQTDNSHKGGYLYAEVVPTQVTAEIARPEDGHKNYLTVIGDVDDSMVQSAKQSFPNAHFNHYKNGNPLAERYRETVGEFPAIVYQRPTGHVIQKASGRNFPKNVVELTGFADDCRPIFRPRPEPTPVQPEPPVAPFTPAVVPDTVDESGDTPVWIYALLLGLSAAGSAGFQWYKEIKGDD